MGQVLKLFVFHAKTKFMRKTSVTSCTLSCDKQAAKATRAKVEAPRMARKAVINAVTDRQGPFEPPLGSPTIRVGRRASSNEKDEDKEDILVTKAKARWVVHTQVALFRLARTAGADHILQQNVGLKIADVQDMTKEEEGLLLQAL